MLSVILSLEQRSLSLHNFVVSDVFIDCTPDVAKLTENDVKEKQVRPALT